MSEYVSPNRVRAYYESRLRRTLRPNAEGWVAVKSPFRQDDNPSFSVNLTRGAGAITARLRAETFSDSK